MIMGYHTAMKIGLLMVVVLAASTLAQSDDYDYESGTSNDGPCPRSAASKELSCRRYTNCTVCENTVTNCHCDSLCAFYGDCCQDAEAYNNSMAWRKVEKETVSCEKRVINNTSVYAAVISKCPTHTSVVDHQLCQNSEIPLLVMGRSTGIIYANHYCAQCHGENDSDYLDIALQCVSQETIDRDRDSKFIETVEPTADSDSVILYQLMTEGSYIGADGLRCHINFGTDVGYRECNPDIIDKCPTAKIGTEIYNLCKDGPVSYVYEETSGGTVINPPYRNRKCAECHDISRDTCSPPTLSNTIKFYRGFSSLVSFTKLSCVRREVETSSNQLSLVNKCDEGKFTCPAGKLYKPMRGCIQEDVGTSDITTDSQCSKWSNSSDYIITDGVVSIPHLNLTSSEYEIIDGQAHICIVKSPGASKDTLNLHSIENPILVVVLLSISLLCLIGQLTLYAIFPALRNVPGLILICLCSALLVAQSAFVPSILIKPATAICSGLAVVQHYAFLATFCWTNVMAFDVARMLSFMTAKLNSKTRFIWYNIYAWGCPIIFVGAALISDYKAGSIMAAYGAAACWFSTSYGILVYFLAPIFLILLINLLLYIVSITAIVRAARQTRMVNPDLKERLFLAIKLIVVMGLPWIMAIFSAFYDNIVINYIFVILNASQGTLIFVCYVFSKTVFTLIKKGELSRSSRKSYSNRTSTFSVQSRKSTNSFSSKIYDRPMSATGSISEEKVKSQPSRAGSSSNNRPKSRESNGDSPMRRESNGDPPMRRQSNGDPPMRRESNDDHPIMKEKSSHQPTIERNVGTEQPIATQRQSISTEDNDKPSSKVTHIVGKTTTV